MPVKTYQSAVVIIPPPQVWEPIQKIRQRYDRHFRRWMPHVTLIYPFRPASEFDEIADSFRAICARFPAFAVRLQEFRFFKHSRQRFTLWLAPWPADPIRQLQAALVEAVPDCNDVNLHASGFTPHLSIGQVSGTARLRTLQDALAQDWRPLEFQLNHISLVWRDDPPDDVFRVAVEIPLG